MPRRSRLAAILALLMLVLTVPVTSAASPGTTAFGDGAPVLSGTAHPATTAEPWNGIALAWTETAGATSYTVWRKTAADADFARLDAGAGTVGLAYIDTAVLPGTAYTYIVAPVLTVAVWLPSNQVTVIAPSPDTTAPVAKFTSPAAGSKVSGRVTVAASATDNVAVIRIELRLPSGVVVSVPGASVTYEWSTKGLKRGSSQTLTVRAFDEAGNIGTAAVTVTIK